MSRTTRTPSAAAGFDDAGVTPLSPPVDAALRACAASPRLDLPGDAKAHLLAAYERRGGVPASGLRLLLGGVRWPAAAVSAAAAAVLVVFSGSLGSGTAPDAPGIDAPVIDAPGIGQARLTAARGNAPMRAALERPLSWERVHPLPKSAARVRVVDDQNLPLISVGWTPDLDGP